MNTSFERCENTKVEWLTPPEIVKQLGEFDLDPCSPVGAPFVFVAYGRENAIALKNSGIEGKYLDL